MTDFEIPILAFFVILGAVFWHFRISYRLSIFLGLLLLLATAMLAAMSQQSVSNSIAAPMFYFFVVGFVLAVVEYRGEATPSPPERAPLPARPENMSGSNGWAVRIRGLFYFLKERVRR